jgi:60 kDa SS-A/Ro ribonucleoprotein
MVKYQQRDGWTHRDVLRLSHPKITINWGPEAVSRASLFRWAVGKEALMGHLPPKLVLAYIEATTASTGRVCELIKEHNLSWEMLPTEKLSEVLIWQTLLPKLPLTALMRNLGRLTSLNILSQPEWNKLVVAKLTDQVALKKARLHPLSLLTALKTYSSGHGNKGSLTWAPVPKIIDALDEAVQLSFGMIEPTGKRFLLGVDVSGSMAGSMISGSPLSAREGAAAMALATARTEEDYGIMAFSGNFIELPLTKKSTFNDAIKITSGLDFDTTDCSLPVLYAMKHKLVVDCFCIYTDSETYAGSMHPFQALQLYRKETGIQAKMIVVGMTSNNFTIADPSDPNMLDVCGFDTTTPQVISEFAKL